MSITEDRHPERPEGSFATGVFGEPVGVAATSATVRRDPSLPVPTNHPPPPARPALSDEAHDANAEARRAIFRALNEARVARDALTRFIGDCDRALDELNGGGW